MSLVDADRVQAEYRPRPALTPEGSHRRRSLWQDHATPRRRLRRKDGRMCSQTFHHSTADALAALATGLRVDASQEVR